MLSQADAALARRDPGLPGLRTLLDETCFAERFRERTGARVEHVRLVYIRYKPGTNCLAGFRMTLDGQTVDVHAKAYRPADRHKLDRAHAEAGDNARLGGRIVLWPDLIDVAVFPLDRRLPSLLALTGSERRREIMSRALPDAPLTEDGTLTPLAYRPERRWVGRLNDACGRSVVVKAYARDAFAAARTAARTPRVDGVRLPRLLGRSRRHSLLVFEWLDGVTLPSVPAGSAAERGALRVVAEALTELHAHSGTRLPLRTRAVEAATLLTSARDIAVLCPQLGTTASWIARELIHRLMEAPPELRALHGDLHPGQILLAREQPIGLLDFDRAACGNPAVDVGSLIAHWERDAACGTLPSATLAARREALFDGYERAAGALPPHIEFYTKAALFRLAPELFRRRAPDWADAVAHVVVRCEQLLRPLRYSARSHGSGTP